MMMIMKKPRRDDQFTEYDISVVNYLEKVINYQKSRPNRRVHTLDVYRKNPWTFFPTPRNLYDGLLLFVKRTVDSGKTDKCESGCWRIIGGDKLIKAEESGRVLGFKKILKFCQKEKPECFKMEKRQPRDKHMIWMMEEYRLRSQWKEDFVLCKIRLFNPKALKFLLGNHIRGYDMRVMD